MNDKTPFEIRKTRLDVILKLFYAFIAIAGAILVLFADPKNEKLINGHIWFLGLETLLFVLLFKMAIYIYNEIRCFQEKSEFLNTYIEKADKSYKKILKSFELSGMFVVLNILCFYGSQFENSWISWATPTNTSMIVAFAAMILCSIVPETLYLKVISFEHNTMPEKQKDMLKIGPFSIIKEIAIRGSVIKNFGLLFATKFIFDLLYLHWFK